MPDKTPDELQQMLAAGTLWCACADKPATTECLARWCLLIHVDTRVVVRGLIE